MNGGSSSPKFHNIKVRRHDADALGVKRVEKTRVGCVGGGGNASSMPLRRIYEVLAPANFRAANVVVAIIKYTTEILSRGVRLNFQKGGGLSEQSLATTRRPKIAKRISISDSGSRFSGPHNSFRVVVNFARVAVNFGKWARGCSAENRPESQPPLPTPPWHLSKWFRRRGCRATEGGIRRIFAFGWLKCGGDAAKGCKNRNKGERKVDETTAPRYEGCNTRIVDYPSD